MSLEGPGGVPIQLAATVLLVDDRPDLHVLCLRRRAGSAFVGGMTVFPGGGVDAHDADPRYAAYTTGLTAVSAVAAGLVSLLEPLTATVLGVVIFHERLGGLGILGAVLLGSALILLVREEGGRTTGC